MKIRTGMVSNSSSASFVIPLVALTPLQVAQILEYPRLARQQHRDTWSISTDEYVVDGYTSMDNGDFPEYLDLIGVPRKAVRFYGD